MHASFSNILQQALSALNQKDNVRAYDLLTHAQRIHADHPDVLHLLGVTCSRLDDFEQADRFFSKAISLSPNNPQFCNSYANLCIKRGQTQKAIDIFSTALAIKPDYVDPYINLGNFLLNENDYSALQKLLNKADTQAVSDSRLLVIKAKYLSALGKPKEAIALLRSKLESHANKVSFLHTLALLLRQEGMPSEAIKYYQDIEQLGLSDASFFHNYANALSDTGELMQATQFYRKALALDLFYYDSHENLCDILFEINQPEYMFASLEQAINTPACPSEIYVLFIEKSLRVGHEKLAQQVLKRFSQAKPDNVLVTYFAALLDAKQNTPHIELLASLSRHQELSIDQRHNCISLLLKQQEYSLAQSSLLPLLKTNEGDQLSLAYLYLCTRFDKSIDHPIRDVGQYVFEYTINKHEDFESLDSYMAALADELKALHTSELQPLEQTLQGGTQTRGNLFNTQSKYIKHIQSEYEKAVHAYIEHLGHLPELYDGFWRKGDIQFEGSWSVILKRSGYHSNHIHPMGWLSSACYIQVPKGLDKPEGDFQFGVPNFIDSLIPPQGSISPCVGKLVLFPSCLWHGTVPFEAREERISIACDISLI